MIDHHLGTFDLAWLVLGLGAGLSLAIFFFGALWWSLRGLAQRHRPLAWMTVSFLARSALALGGFWAISLAGWAPLAAALLAFLTTRVALCHMLPPATKPGANRWS